MSTHVDKFVDGDGDVIHLVEFMSATIRVRTHSNEYSGKSRFCEVRFPDGTKKRGLTENYDPYTINRYLPVASIIAYAKMDVRDWHEAHPVAVPVIVAVETLQMELFA